MITSHDMHTLHSWAFFLLFQLVAFLFRYISFSHLSNDIHRLLYILTGPKINTHIHRHHALFTLSLPIRPIFFLPFFRWNR